MGVYAQERRSDQVDVCDSGAGRSAGGDTVTEDVFPGPKALNCCLRSIHAEVDAGLWSLRTIYSGIVRVAGVSSTKGKTQVECAS